jgi:hypothetical protein
MVGRFFVLVLLAIALTCEQASALDLSAPAHERLAAPDAEPSYQKHVLPLMSKVGCSGRACHGSFQGQGGFRLSLFGYDFATDHQALLGGAGSSDNELRVNLKRPAESLILKKPSGQDDHGGEKLFEVGSWQYNVLARWIEQGAKDDSATNPAIDRLEIQPAEIVFRKAGETVQLRVLAHWRDGTVENITDLARFRTNDDSVAVVDEKTGLVRAAGAGDTHIVAFYDNGVAPVAAMLPLSDQVGKNYPEVAAGTRVDELILTKLKKVGIVPSEACTDEEFLRRASLDITGTLPAPTEIRRFIADRSPNKRSAKVDELLERPTYVAWWTTVLCDLTGNNTNQLEIAGKYHEPVWAGIWYEWIFRRVAENTPYDRMMEGLVLAVSRPESQSYADYCAEMTSYVRTDKPADFTGNPTLPMFWGRRNLQKPEERALAFSHTFLGVRLQCAECHKHPFDQWTQQDFQSFQAFFNGVVYKRQNRREPEVAAMMRAVGVDPDADKGNGNDPGKRLAAAAREGKTVPFPELIARAEPQKGDKFTKNLKTVAGGSRVITPRVLGGEEVVLANFDDPRRPLMDWMRSIDNPYFARAWVNRVWAKYFGVGIIEPADDLNLANPPSNAELLDYLTRGFVESGYDMKWLHRTIATSDAYGRSRKTNATNAEDRRNFSHALLRRIPAEVAIDALATATAGKAELMAMQNVRTRYIGLRTTQGGDGRGQREYSLGIFGRPDRITTCDCERSNDPTLLQSLYLYNDGEIWKRINSNSGWIVDLERVERNPDVAGRIKRLKEILPQMETEGDAQRAKMTRAEMEKLENVRDLNINDRAGLIEELYLRTVSRLPTKNEKSDMLAHLEKAPSTAAGLRELLWVMLNTKEFILNR